jgi:hypothetical protein
MHTFKVPSIEQVRSLWGLNVIWKKSRETARFADQYDCVKQKSVESLHTYRRRQQGAKRYTLYIPAVLRCISLIAEYNVAVAPREVLHLFLSVDHSVPKYPC